MQYADWDWYEQKPMTVTATRPKPTRRKRGKTVEIVLTIPDDVAADLQNGGTRPLSRRALELIAVDGFKAGELSRVEVGRLLDFETPFDVNGFLKKHGVYDVDYVDEGLAREEETGETIGERLERKGLIGIIDSSIPDPDSPPIHTPFGQLLIEKFRKQGLRIP